MFRKSNYMLYVNSYKIPNILISNSKTINVLKTINYILTQFKKFWNFFYSLGLHNINIIITVVLKNFCVNDNLVF